MKHVSIRMLVATLCSLLFVFSVLASEQFGTDFSHIGVTVYDSFAHDKVASQTGYPPCINEVHTRFHNSNNSNCFLDFNAKTVLFS